MTVAFGAILPVQLEVPDQVDERYFEQEILPAATAAEPAGEEGIKADIRSCMGPIREQGLRPTCVAHAVCAQFECLRNRNSPAPVDLSEQFSYWSAKQADGHPQGDGTMIDDALNCAISDGICNEQTWPYNPDVKPGDPGQGPPPQEAITEASGMTIAGKQVLQGADSQAVCQALDAGKPVALSIRIWESWPDNPAIWNLGTVPLP